MSDLGHEVRSLLWEWLGEIDDPDPEQRAWKIHYLDGMLRAVEVAGLLDDPEIAAFRTFAAGQPVPTARGDQAAAEAHLTALREELKPMSRGPDPDAFDRSQRFSAALEALDAAGLLGGDATRWRSASLAAEAPWLDAEARDEIASVTGEGTFAGRSASHP